MIAGPAVAASAEVDAVYPKAHAPYLDLHQHPELSGSETQTAAKLAAELRALGYTVTEHVGGTGVVALLRNGRGKTVMLRTELDALPVEERERFAIRDAVYNDPALTRRLRAVLETTLGKENVITEEPITASEDFSAFVQQGIPGFYLSLGGADPQKFAQAKATDTLLPSNHSPLFAPDVDPALHTAITAELAMLRDLLRAGS